jgi:signal transduction histidine kinase
MQNELIGMTLSQMQKALAATAAAVSEGEERAWLDRTMLVSRSKLTGQMKEKAQMALDIMQRVRLLTELTDPGPGYTVGAIICNEMEFRQFAIELHQVIFTLLAIASEAMQDRVATPRIMIEAGVQENCFFLAIEDNGQGLPAESLLPYFRTVLYHQKRT